MTFFNISKKAHHAYAASFLAFLFFSAIFCSYTRVNNLLHLSIAFFIISLFALPECRKVFSLNSERKKSFIFILLFLLYFSLSNLWGGSSSTLKSSLTHSVYIIMYLGMIVSLLDSKHRVKVVLVSMAGLLCLCLYCLIFDYHAIMFIRRISQGNPAPENVIDLSGYAAIGILLALIAFRETSFKLILLAIPVFLAVMMISQSRGPFIALVFSLIITLPFKKITRKSIFYTFLVLVICSVAVMFTPIGERMIQRFSQLYVQSFLRLSIWHHTLELIGQAPFFGHGFNSQLNFINYSGEHIHTTHSLYLGTLLKGGIAGLILLLLMLFNGSKSLIISAQQGQRWELCLFIFSLLFYLSQGIFVISNPTEYWYLFWFPLAFCVAAKKSPY